jgi:hypothetical protein
VTSSKFAVRNNPFDIAVRRVRWLLRSGEGLEEQERVAKWWATRFPDILWRKVMLEAQKPGLTDHRRHETP